jgi:diacylglycerol kinase family enzyme
LVSNNRYLIDLRPQHGTRGMLDGGALGVVAVGGPPARGLTEWSTPTFSVDSSAPVAAGVDGESAALDPPLQFEILPRAVRVLVPPRRRGR